MAVLPTRQKLVQQAKKENRQPRSSIWCGTFILLKNMKTHVDQCYFQQRHRCRFPESKTPMHLFFVFLSVIVPNCIDRKATLFKVNKNNLANLKRAENAYRSVFAKMLENCSRLYVSFKMSYLIDYSNWMKTLLWILKTPLD